MDLIGPLLDLLVQVGKFVNFHNANAVKDRVMNLRVMYDQEMAKGENRDDALVYSIRAELRHICQLYCAHLERPPTSG
ncbi:MAG: hypothetical protein EBZ69_09625 [Alphaproteobacteria bacterium]|nr:hypothetical protein [Alphaproteobacteria bacterium]